MNKGEKKSRQGLHVIGSTMIVLGFLTIIAVLFAPAWLSLPILFLDFNYSYDFNYLYIVGLLGAVMMIFFGAVISEKARGQAKVRGFLLDEDAIDRSEESDHHVTLERMLKKKLITKEESDYYLNMLNENDGK